MSIEQALHPAAENGHIAVVRLLLENELGIETKDDGRATTLERTSVFQLESYIMPRALLLLLL
jgi:hypothetical protein